MASRAALETRLDSLQNLALSVEDRDRRQALRAEIEAIGYRLREGDIFPGDVISLAVTGETDWTGDFIVTPARTLELERIDPIEVSGVLYSELEPHLRESLGRYLREPRVRAEALKRVAVLGGVGNPGFMTVSGATIVSDLIMDAGGPVSTAKLDDAQFRRNGKRLGFDTGRIDLQFYSLDQLGIRSGDELHIPASRPGQNFWQDLRFIVFGISGVVLLMTRIF